MAGPPRCELCGARTAPLRCPGCRLTYYCDVSHQRTDWISIHGHICHLLIPVLGPQPCFHSEKDRKHGKEQLLRRQASGICRCAAHFQPQWCETLSVYGVAGAAVLHCWTWAMTSQTDLETPVWLKIPDPTKVLKKFFLQGGEALAQVVQRSCGCPIPEGVQGQESLIAVALSTAQGFVWAGKPLEAIPAALQALRFSSQVFGSGSVHLVPIFLLLAEASTGTGRLREAAKYLSQAQWIVLQTPDCSAALQSKLHRGLGLFSIAEGNLDQALYHLANDVYVATAEFGLNSFEVSGGYFHMANIFFHQNKMDTANSLYTEVSSLWHDWLLSSLQGHQRVLRAQAEASPFSEDEEGLEDEMTEVQHEEGTRVLQAVLKVREQGPLQHPGETARVLHALAMIHYLSLDLAKAREVGMKAFNLTKQLPQQDSLETIGHLLELINAQFSHTT